MRKFRVRFLTYKNKSGQEHCQSCVRELSRFFEINEGGRGAQAEKMDESTTSKTTMATTNSAKEIAKVKTTLNKSHRLLIIKFKLY